MNLFKNNINKTNDITSEYLLKNSRFKKFKCHSGTYLYGDYQEYNLYTKRRGLLCDVSVRFTDNIEIYVNESLMKSFERLSINKFEKLLDSLR